MLKKHWVLIINLVVLLFLLAKNPFSARTLIPNFEPYPDTIHYIVPARSFVAGGPFSVAREERYIKPGVPPLYSFVLIPLFMIHNDPRMFYFTNILLSVGVLILLYAIIKKILFTVENKSSSFSFKLSTFSLLTFISLFFYVTNYFIYWYPSLAMAENLTMFLFLLNLYLFVVPHNKHTIILGAVTPFLFFLTKYANISLTGSFLLMYAIKIYLERKNNKKESEDLKIDAIYFGVSIFVMLLILVYSESLPGLSSITALFANILPHTKGSVARASSGGWFSLSYIHTYLPSYVRALFGGYSSKYLWDSTPIWPRYIGIPGVLGLFLGIKNEKTRPLSIVLILSLSTSLLFLSTFYSQDMRYLNFAIPTILIGFVMFWDSICTLLRHSVLRYRIQKNNLQNILNILLIFLFLFYFTTNAVRLKKQIMLNIKYAETPWYYLSVLKLNDYFKDYPQSKKMPVVISAMIPYYIDFYSNGQYSLLPLSKNQEFRDHREEAWGKFDYSDLILLYTKILYSGHEVYIHNYGIGNEKPLQEDFKKIQDTFILTKVATGCFDACDIWQLKVKFPLKRKEDINY